MRLTSDTLEGDKQGERWETKEAQNDSLRDKVNLAWKHFREHTFKHLIKNWRVEFNQNEKWSVTAVNEVSQFHFYLFILSESYKTSAWTFVVLWEHDKYRHDCKNTDCVCFSSTSNLNDNIFNSQHSWRNQISGQKMKIHTSTMMKSSQHQALVKYLTKPYATHFNSISRMKT